MNLSVDPSVVSALGWALIHSLWQCTVLAGLAWLGFRLFRQRCPQARYLLGCVLLGFMLVLPLGTFLALWAPVRVTPGAAYREAEVALLVVRAVTTPPEPALRSLLPWIIVAWAAGVTVMGLRLAGGWIWVQRLRWLGVEGAEALWQERLETLALQMEIGRPVRLARSLRVEAPLVLGWLKPVILVPGAIFTSLDPASLEAILAHELAHIRRHDYLANLLQSTVEALLFFHPAVWWLSAQIRAERENCCDDIAVSLCGDPLRYARALAALEELRHSLEPNPTLALAATGGPLMNRIRRLIAPTLPPSPAARAGLVAALAVSVLGAASTLGFQPHESPKPPEAASGSGGEKKVVTVIVDKDAKSPQKLKIEMKGKVKIQPEAQPPVTLEDGARLEIEGKDGDRLRTYRAERGPAGETRLWMVEGKEESPDARAEAWLKRSLEVAQKFTSHLGAKGVVPFGKEFRWTGHDAKAERQLEAEAKLLEEKAKALAEKRLAKGIPEPELASLQEEVAKHAKAVAEQARKVARSMPAIDSREIKVLVTKAEQEAEAKETGADSRRHVVVKRLTGEDGSMTVHVEGDSLAEVGALDGGKDGKRVVLHHKESKPGDGEVVIFRMVGGESKAAEIEALKKAIEKMQGRLEQLQKESAAK